MTSDIEGKLAIIRGRVSDAQGFDALMSLRSDIEQLAQEAARLRHAFETTAADRDRLAREVAEYRHAFETTAADRDRLAQDCRQLTEFRDAFETTSADRDRLAEECRQLADFRDAYHTTAADRDVCAAWMEQLRTLSDPLDAGYLRLDFLRFAGKDRRDLGERLIADWQKADAEGRHADIIASVLDNVPARIAMPLPPEYAEAFSAYYMASMLVWLGRYRDAAGYLDKLPFSAPPDGADFLPYDLKQGSRVLESWQAMALARNAPGAVLVSLWKSASAHLTAAISAVFDLPVMRVSVGEGPQAVVVTRWLQQVMQGGAVTHEHFPACLNIEQIERSGIEDIVVQVRDPRDVAYSALRMRESWQAQGVRLDGGDSENGVGEVPNSSADFIAQTAAAAGWIDDWIDAPEQAGITRLKVRFLCYDRVVNDLAAAFRFIYGDRFDRDAETRLEAFLIRGKDGRAQGANFRSGIGGEWRSYPGAVQRQAFDAIPPRVKALLALQP